MTSQRIKAIVAFGLMLAALIGAIAWKPNKNLADTRPRVELNLIFPTKVGEWSLDRSMPVQLVSPDQAAVLNKLYNQTLSRTYVNRRGQRIMLSVVYGGDQSDGTRAHRPEVCYPAQGFQIISNQLNEIRLSAGSLRVRELVAVLGSRTEPITYWVVIGDRIALSGTEQKLAQLSYSTRGVVSDGMLVRVSTIDADPKRAFPIHQEFINELSQVLDRSSRPQVLGVTSG